MDHPATKYWAERYDDWTRKLEVGAWLRHRELSDYHRWKARLLREQLEVLEHDVEDDEREKVNRLTARISRTHACVELLPRNSKQTLQDARSGV